MRCRWFLPGILAVLLIGILRTAPASGIPQGKKDYLSDAEGDKIREAFSPPEKIVLFLSFAEDRLKKFQYELSRKPAQRRRGEVLNSLLNAYVGCVDDAADQATLGQEKQVDVRDSLKLMKLKGAVFLDTLEKIQKEGVDIDLYKDTLEDAIEGTKDMLADVDKASKEATPGPVRRKPS
jgi:hypothetical protein